MHHSHRGRCSTAGGTSIAAAVAGATVTAAGSGGAARADAAEESGGGSAPPNLYSYCVEELLPDPDCAPSKWTRRTLKSWCVMLLLLALLTFAQLVFAFGFFDAARLFGRLGNSGEYRDPVPVSFFYPLAHVGEVPTINLLASLVSLVLLALIMKNDTRDTLLTTCPLEPLFLPGSAHADAPCGGDGVEGSLPGAAASRARRSRSRCRRAMAAAGRCALCVGLQVAWCSRVLLLPVLGALGTAQAFTASTSAKDIVLDSVAIGFVFELDDFLYTAAIPTAAREKYENRPPRRTSPLAAESAAGASPRQQRLIGKYCWLTFVLDVTMPSYFYLKWMEILPGSVAAFKATYLHYDLVRPYVMVRGALLALCHAHVAHLSPRRGSARRVCVGVVGFAVCIVATAAFVLSFGLGVGLEGRLASEPSAAFEIAAIRDCANGVSKEITYVSADGRSETTECFKMFDMGAGALLGEVVAETGARSKAELMLKRVWSEAGEDGTFAKGTGAAEDGKGGGGTGAAEDGKRLQLCHSLGEADLPGP